MLLGSSRLGADWLRPAPRCGAMTAKHGRLLVLPALALSHCPVRALVALLPPVNSATQLRPLQHHRRHLQLSHRVSSRSTARASSMACRRNLTPQGCQFGGEPIEIGSLKATLCRRSDASVNCWYPCWYSQTQCIRNPPLAQDDTSRTWSLNLN